MPYSAKVMFSVVNDVAAYPEFLSWCGGIKIHAETSDSMEASVLMQKGKLNHWFSTKNIITENRRIEMDLIDGPFRSLHGIWEFEMLSEDSCKIKLDLNFELSTGLTSVLIAPIFNQIANTMVDSFCSRAHEIERNEK